MTSDYRGPQPATTVHGVIHGITAMPPKRLKETE